MKRTGLLALDLGHLLEAEALLIAQQHGRPGGLVELGDAGSQGLAQPRVIDQLDGSWRRIAWIDAFEVLEAVLAAAALLHGIEDAVVRDREQPDAHRRAAGKARQIAIRLDEDLLMDIISERGVAQRLAAVAVHGGAVALHQAMQRARDIILTESLDHVAIGIVTWACFAHDHPRLVVARPENQSIQIYLDIRGEEGRLRK